MKDMKVIVFAATKGGTGKSTLAFNVAVEAAKHGSVFMADLDPQKSLTMLSDARDRQGDLLGEQPLLLTDVSNVMAAVRDLARSQYQRDYMIVDTPGSHMPIIQNALHAADCIVLPVQPSPLDILAQEDVAPMIDELGKGSKTLFVINRVDGRAAVDDTSERIGQLFPTPPVKVNQRQAYSRGAIRGLSGPEVNPKDCTAEIAGLWAAIDKILRKDGNAENQHDGSAAARTA